jgi:hypothetical protein
MFEPKTLGRGRGNARRPFGLAGRWSRTALENYGAGREWFGLRPAARKRERAPEAAKRRRIAKRADARAGA